MQAHFKKVNLEISGFENQLFLVIDFDNFCLIKLKMKRGMFKVSIKVPL